MIRNRHEPNQILAGHSFTVSSQRASLLARETSESSQFSATSLGQRVQSTFADPLESALIGFTIWAVTARQPLFRAERLMCPAVQAPLQPQPHLCAVP